MVEQPEKIQPEAVWYKGLKYKLVNIYLDREHGKKAKKVLLQQGHKVVIRLLEGNALAVYTHNRQMFD